MMYIVIIDYIYDIKCLFVYSYQMKNAHFND